MTANVNKATLIGFLGEDPVRRETQQGDAIISLSLGTTERWKGRNGEWQGHTEWHRVVVYNEALGKRVMAHLRKGGAVYVEGTIRSRKYTDRQGVERKVSEIIVPKFGGDLRLMDRRQDEGGRRSEDGGGHEPGGDIGDDAVPY